MTALPAKSGEQKVESGKWRRARRTRVLVEGDPQLAEELCAAIEAVCALADVTRVGRGEGGATNAAGRGESDEAGLDAEQDGRGAAEGGVARAGLGAGGAGACQLRLISEPREVLVMNRVRESARGTLFYLGEALLSECKVAIGTTTGIGLVLGVAPEKAYQLAVIDAAFSLPEPLPEQPQWQRRLLAAERRLEQSEASKCEELESTRVEFFSMDGT
jgi:alpha-D-ribose 1-methylphosphonate 5-triphosphate synthase subunit PhnG